MTAPGALTYALMRRWRTKSKLLEILVNVAPTELAGKNECPRKSSSTPDIQYLLNEYQDIFQDPKRMPPFRKGFNHKILLKEGSNPINLRPYRYPLLQKDVIEKLTQEFLEQGFIQTSNSAFATLVVLVKKKDGGWRMADLCSDIDIRKKPL
ncbi:hypothetical protein Tco_1339822 [Tanacetum coccineum]